MAENENGSRLKLTLKIMNIIISIMLIVFGVFRYIDLQIDMDQPWTVFQPAYTILFGILLILSEAKIKYITENFKFLSSYIGRGFYVIYLSTIVTGNLTGGDLNKYVSITVAVLLLLSGVIYIFIQCCCADVDADATTEKTEPEETSPTTKTPPAAAASKPAASKPAPAPAPVSKPAPSTGTASKVPITAPKRSAQLVAELLKDEESSPPPKSKELVIA